MKQQIITALQKVLEKLSWNIEIELTDAKGHSDFATNIAMKLASKLHQQPLQIAKTIIDNLDCDLISRAEIAGPGFINIFLKKNQYVEIVKQILNQKNDFGKANQNKYINVEYVSANPTGYLHLGHASNAALGSTLSSILKFAGNRVDQEYYVNDYGNQIKILGASTLIRYQQLLGKDVELSPNFYQGEEIFLVAKSLIKDFGNKYLNHSDNETIALFSQKAKEYMLKKIKQHLALFGVKMDHYFFESTLYDKNLILPCLQKIPILFKKDGATWIRTTQFGDDKDRVLIKKDQTLTYFAPDIAYHFNKLTRNYDELINIWGADHIGYISRMKIALEQLGFPANKIDILTIQMVRLIKNGQEFKMSKRSGQTFTLKDLINIVGKDAARFFLVNRSNNSKLDFDIDLATEKSHNNPVFVLQYAHARANQLLKKSQKTPIPRDYQEKEIDIINLLKQFPDLIIKIADTHRVNLLPKYLIELAKKFNWFYSNNRIIGSRREETLLALVLSCKQVLMTGLTLLGVTCPDVM